MFEQVVRAGLRRDSVVGASDEQIDLMASAQGVAHVPEAVREVFRLVGVRSGLWLAGTAFSVNSITGETKQQVLASLGHLEHDLVDPGGMLVLTAHQAYAYQVIDGADLGLDDPPVWSVVEGERVVRAWESTSDWFARTAPDIPDLLDVLELMEDLGKQPPVWARDIEAR
ncbi:MULTISPECIES: hypothetical protein [Actinosynnema]|uniref:hypothetical protein n=1 Tax=Actinosynnema TaxID=40566 RepID=UPI0020A36716|nr:hypothetical protein [Actinosynnema pretiosum]MCP2099773.1 hypothetical protein [Actinosynnema pretiosum]